MESKISSPTDFRYGDIIRINSPENNRWHEKQFFILQIRPNGIQLLDIDSLDQESPAIYQIVIENGVLQDDTIIGFDLLARRETLGYIAQNGITIGTRIEIQWSDPNEASLQGVVSRVENDGMEVQESETGETYYFDFAYQGLPPEITNIRIVKTGIGAQVDEPVQSAEPVQPYSEEPVVDPLQEKLVDGDKTLMEYMSMNDIESDDLDIVLMEEVGENKKRYTVDAQLRDIVETFQAKLAPHEQSPAKERELERFKDRFLELRMELTKFEPNGMMIPKKPDTKPLASKVGQLDRYKWLKPVIKAPRRIFLEGSDFELDERSEAKLMPKNVAAIPSDAWNHYRSNELNGSDLRYKRMVRGMIEPEPYDLNGGGGYSMTLTQSQHALLGNLPRLMSTSVHADMTSIQRGLMARFLEPFQNSRFKEPKIIQGDVLSVQSIYMGSKPMMEASRPFLPRTALIHRVGIQRTAEGLPMFMKPSEVQMDPLTQPFSESSDSQTNDSKSNDSNDLSKEKGSNPIQKLGSKPLMLVPQQGAGIQQKNIGTIQQLLEAVLPDAEYYLQNMLENDVLTNPTTLDELEKKLEPIAVYHSNLTFRHYQLLTSIVSQNIRAYMNEVIQNKNQLRSILQPMQRYFKETRLNHFEALFQSPANPDRSLTKTLEDIYHTSFNAPVGLSDAELLVRFGAMDHGMAVAVATQVLHLADTLPENMFVAPIIEELEDRKAKKRPASLIDKVLAKVYVSEEELRKDNGDNTVIYYDEGRDLETPYSEIELLQNEKGQLATTEEEKLEFLQQALSAKYRIGDEEAGQMADAVLHQKRKVRDGDYAALERRQVVIGHSDDPFDKKKHEILTHRIFKRVKGYWRWEQNMTMDQFETNQALIGRTKQKDINANKELSRRFEVTMEELRAELNDQFMEAQRRAKRRERVVRHLDLRQNDLLWNLSQAVSEPGIIESPYIPLRDDILSLKDVGTKQFAIIQFFTLFCRNALATENPRWAYCKESDRPLLPIAFYDLAQAFQQGHEVYDRRIGQVCRMYGTMDETGGNWVDRESRLIICPIELVGEYDPNAEKLQEVANEEAEVAQQLQTVMEQLFEEKGKAGPQNVVYSFFLQQTGVKPDAVLNQSFDHIMNKLMSNTQLFPSKERYDAKLKKMMETTDKPLNLPPYELFVDKNKVFASVATFFMIVQTRIPDVQRLKNHAGPVGCNYSFDGFPVYSEDENEDVGIRYMACILLANQSDQRPWNAVRKIKLDGMLKDIKRSLQVIMKDTVLAGSIDAKKRYVVKRGKTGGSGSDKSEFNSSKKASILDSFIPKSMKSMIQPHDKVDAKTTMNPVTKKRLGWQHFLPPMIPFSVADKITIEKDAIKGLFQEFQRNVQTTLTRSGQKRKLLLTIHTWISTLTYAFVEKVNKAVQGEQMYLLTQNQIPFLENTCCHDGTGIKKVLEWMIQKEPMISNYVAMISDLDKGLEQLTVRASMLFYVKQPLFPLDIEMKVSPVQNIVLAYVHYLYDMNLYDDPEIQTVIKVAAPTIEYRACISSQDKVKFFEKNNPDIGMNQGMFQQMMRIIHIRKTIAWQPPESWNQRKDTQLSKFMEQIKLWDETESTDPFFPRTLAKVLENPTEEERMIRALGLKADRLRQVLRDQGFVQEIHKWDPTLDPRTVVQFYTNSVYSLLRFFPAIVSTKRQPRTSLMGPPVKKGDTQPFGHKYWDFSWSHQEMLEEKERELFQAFQPFMDDGDFMEMLQGFMDKTEVLYDAWQSIPNHSLSIGFLKAFHYCLTLDIYFKYFEEADRFIKNKMENESRESLQRPLELDGYAYHTEDQTLLAEALDQQVRVKQVNLTKQLLSFLRTCQNMDKTRFQWNNISYAEVDESSRLNVYQEKTGMIAMFNRMKDDERRIEKVMKKFKLGRWNVGKEVFKYDKNQFDKEIRDENLFHLTGKMLEGGEGEGDGDEWREGDGEWEDNDYDEEGNDVGPDYEAEDDEYNEDLEDDYDYN